MLRVFIDSTTKQSNDDATGGTSTIGVAQVVPLRVVVANVGDVNLPLLTLDVNIAKVSIISLHITDFLIFFVNSNDSYRIWKMARNYRTFHIASH